MRRAVATLFAVAVVLSVAVPAAGAGSSSTSPAALAKQVQALQKQVTALKKQVKAMKSNLGQTEAIAVVALLYGGCNSAVTADALAGSGIAGYTAPPNPVQDYNACSDLQQYVKVSPTIVRQPNTATVNVFQELLNVFKP